MKSASKTVLYAKIVNGKSVHQWPVAAFNTYRLARAFAPEYFNLYQKGASEELTALTPAAVLGPEGEALTGLRFSLVTLPYQPDISAPPADLFE